LKLYGVAVSTVITGLGISMHCHWLEKDWENGLFDPVWLSIMQLCNIWHQAAEFSWQMWSAMRLANELYSSSEICDAQAYFSFFRSFRIPEWG